MFVLYFVERFTVIGEGTQLKYDIEISDPVNLAEPVSAEAYVVWETLPGITVQPFECAA